MFLDLSLFLSTDWYSVIKYDDNKWWINHQWIWSEQTNEQTKIDIVLSQKKTQEHGSQLLQVNSHTVTQCSVILQCCATKYNVGRQKAGIRCRKVLRFFFALLRIHHVLCIERAVRQPNVAWVCLNKHMRAHAHAYTQELGGTHQHAHTNENEGAHTHTHAGKHKEKKTISEPYFSGCSLGSFKAV